MNMFEYNWIHVTQNERQIKFRHNDTECKCTIFTNKYNVLRNELNGLLISAHAFGVSRPCILEVRVTLYEYQIKIKPNDTECSVQFSPINII